jgi:type II secretory pathway pseudopilin PulG
MIIATFSIIMSVAVPEYAKILARSRQSEARLLLGAAFIGVKTYFTENGTYTGCIRQTGFVPINGSGQYYTVGFGNPPAVGCGPDGTMDCMRYNWTGAVVLCVNPTDIVSIANAVSFTGAAIYGADANFEACVGGSVVNKGSFTIGACGNISRTANTHDGWTINDTKIMSNVFVAL